MSPDASSIAYTRAFPRSAHRSRGDSLGRSVTSTPSARGENAGSRIRSGCTTNAGSEKTAPSSSRSFTAGGAGAGPRGGGGPGGGGRPLPGPPARGGGERGGGGAGRASRPSGDGGSRRPPPASRPRTRGGG